MPAPRQCHVHEPGPPSRAGCLRSSPAWTGRCCRRCRWCQPGSPPPAASASTSCGKRTSICAVVWPLIPRLSQPLPGKERRAALPAPAFGDRVTEEHHAWLPRYGGRQSRVGIAVTLQFRPIGRRCCMKRTSSGRSRSAGSTNNGLTAGTSAAIPWALIAAEGNRGQASGQGTHGVSR